MLENPGAYLEAAGLIILLSPIRLMKRFVRVSPPAFIARHVQAPAMQSEIRKELQPVEKLIERSGIEEGMSVMELGCGTGLHTIDFAKAIGKEGKLYAVDIRLEYIDILKRRLEKPEYKDINNIEIKLASAYDLPFQDNSIDLVMRQISERRLV